MLLLLIQRGHTHRFWNTMTPIGAAVETEEVESSNDKTEDKTQSPVTQTKGRLVGDQGKDQDVGFGESKAQTVSIKETSAAINTSTSVLTVPASLFLSCWVIGM